MIFNFEIVNVDDVPGGFRYQQRNFKPSEIRRVLAKQQKMMSDGNGWNSLFLENHDNPRSVSRYVSDRTEGRGREIGAKLLSLMIAALSGTLFIYQGQEIAMRNVSLDWDASEYIDIESVNYWKKAQAQFGDQPGRLAEAKRLLNRKARDNSRTPMQWTSEAKNAGFCPPDVKPWMRVQGEDATQGWNVQDQMKESLGIWPFWSLGLMERKKHKDTFVYGDFELLGDDDEDDPVFAFRRKSDQESMVVVLNLSGKEVKWTLPHGTAVKMWVGGSYVPDINLATSGELTLRPWEGVLGAEEFTEIHDYTKD